jgi:hypothetical protein
MKADALAADQSSSSSRNSAVASWLFLGGVISISKMVQHGTCRRVETFNSESEYVKGGNEGRTCGPFVFVVVLVTFTP